MQPKTNKSGSIGDGPVLIPGLSPERSEAKRQLARSRLLIATTSLIVGAIVAFVLKDSLASLEAIPGIVRGALLAAPFLPALIFSGLAYRGGAMYNDQTVKRRSLVLLVLSFVAMMANLVYSISSRL